MAMLLLRMKCCHRSGRRDGKLWEGVPFELLTQYLPGYVDLVRRQNFQRKRASLGEGSTGEKASRYVTCVLWYSVRVLHPYLRYKRTWSNLVDMQAIRGNVMPCAGAGTTILTAQPLASTPTIQPECWVGQGTGYHDVRLIEKQIYG
jgi:hypothetical protein